MTSVQNYFAASEARLDESSGKQTLPLGALIAHLGFLAALDFWAMPTGPADKNTDNRCLSRFAVRCS